MLKLRQWILENCCRLVALCGMGEIGKTWLSVKLAEQIKDEFKFVIWRSLRYAPAIHLFLAQLIQLLSQQSGLSLAETFSEQHNLLSFCEHPAVCCRWITSYEKPMSAIRCYSHLFLVFTNDK
ncbi:MAG: hypothetical protein KME40_29175 [Komarekiella atlantica HA4396-MV6]|nr:hypothetical protein [Komarekiella atlantica HA4396-MV6]